MALAVALALPGAASAASELEQPATQTQAPRFYELSARQAIAQAEGAARLRAERRRHGGLRPVAYVKRPGRWQVSFYKGDQQVVQVIVDDRSGAVLEQWTGDQIAWTMARGYEGAFGRKLNAPYVWLPLCVLFLAPFVDPRRPFRLLHLDLLALLAFGVSHFYFNRGEIETSVPLVYPVLLYLLVRTLAAGLRPRERTGSLVPYAPPALVVVALVFLLAFRVGLNVIDSNVIDVGYAGVVGADRIVDGDELYGEGFSDDVERGDTYGPLNYLLYVPFEQALPWSGRWDELPAAHGAAILFDLLAVGGLLLLGRRLRPGREGRLLGLALAYAWVAYPYTAFVLETNADDTLVAVACIGAMLALTLDPARVRLAAAARGAAVALGAAAKFAPLALAPLFARASGGRSGGVAAFALTLAIVLAALFVPLLPDGGPRELYDRTVGYQAGRPAPFSAWGQWESLGWLHTGVKALAVALVLLVAVRPRRPDSRQVAALGGAVLIALQLVATYWFYLYIVWFLPFVLVAALAAYRQPSRVPAAPVEVAREREVVAA